ncbi:MAG: endolytic transglycosylase MltG [Alistipes sp.]|nr:endolytic transglycosylase MltG [Alistipes sp.]
MRKIFIYLLVFLLLAGAVVAYCGYSMFYTSAVTEDFSVRITPKTDYEAVVEKVKKYCKYDFAFEFYADYLDLKNNLRVGTYLMFKEMSVMTIVRTLKYGESTTLRLTINNARTPEALAKKIASKSDITEEAMLKALRDPKLVKELGFDSAEAMFSIFIPNTYEFYSEITAEELVRKFKAESDKFWATPEHQKGLDHCGLSPYEVMILASIVHEETNAVSEMSRIAGVYMNRLQKDMLLQADPTVKYALGDPTIKRILKRHLEIESPYNTYKYKGLPPTPIAMPDVAAIEAVLNYEVHDYLYFCARPEFDGKHNFARTGKEHSRNARAYHEALNKRNIRK